MTNVATKPVPYAIGDIRVVDGIPFIFEAHGATEYSAPYRWRAMPLAHDISVWPSRDDRSGWLLRMHGVTHGTDNLQRIMVKSIKWRTAQIATARKDLAEYDAALTNLRVRDVLAAASAAFPKGGTR